MSKYARDRKRLLRILKKKGFPSSRKRVRYWMKIVKRPPIWQNEQEVTIINAFYRRKDVPRHWFWFFNRRPIEIPQEYCRPYLL